MDTRTAAEAAREQVWRDAFELPLIVVVAMALATGLIVQTIVCLPILFLDTVEGMLSDV